MNWHEAVREIKHSVWGTPVIERDSYFAEKFYKDANGELQVRPHWSFDLFILTRVADWQKTPSPESARFAA